MVDNPPSTIPPNILDTSTQPDLVIIEEQCVTLIELTIPFNSQESLTNAKTRKENKENYQLVLEDLESRGYVANLITIEIGSTQSLASRTRSALLEAFPSLSKAKLTTLLDQAASTVIMALLSSIVTLSLCVFFF